MGEPARRLDTEEGGVSSLEVASAQRFKKYLFYFAFLLYLWIRIEDQGDLLVWIKLFFKKKKNNSFKTLFLL